MVLMIQDDAWPRMVSLAAEMGWDRHVAIGAVVSLWRNSQASGVSRTSRRVVLTYCELSDHTCHDAFMEALQLDHVRFIHRVDGGDLYEIHGNKQNIEKVNRTRELNTWRINKRWADERTRLQAAYVDTGGITAGTSHGTTDGSSPVASPGIPKPSQAKLNQAELINSPLTPLTTRGEKSEDRKLRRSAKDRGSRYAAKALGAVWNNLPDAEARLALGPTAWRLVVERFGTWSRFVDAVCRSVQEKKSGGTDATFFEAQLRDCFRTALLAEPPALANGRCESGGGLLLVPTLQPMGLS